MLEYEVSDYPMVFFDGMLAVLVRILDVAFHGDTFSL